MIPYSNFSGEEWVLTSAKCANILGTVEIMLGAHDRSEIEPTQLTVGVYKKITHEGWDQYHPNENDIGLLKFYPITFTGLC